MQLRKSPGGSTPSVRRKRPDEPPSSATVTMAVMLEVWRLSPPQQSRHPRAAADHHNTRSASLAAMFRHRLHD